MQRAGNIAALMVFIRRYLSHTSSKRNKHYNFSITHIKTELDNGSYLLKKTTAIPKEINCYNTILSEESNLSNFNDSLSPNNEILVGLGVKFQEGDRQMQDLFNKLISPSNKKEKLNYCFDSYFSGSNAGNNNVIRRDNSSTESTRVHFFDSRLGKNVEVDQSKLLLNGSDFNWDFGSDKNNKDDIFCHSKQKGFENKQNETISYVNLNEIDKIERKIANDCHADQRNINIKDSSTSINNERINEKIIDLLFNYKSNEISFNNMLIMNHKSHKKPFIIYIKEKEVYVIASEKSTFDNEIMHYINTLDRCESKLIQTERLNVIRFYKMPHVDSFLETNLPLLSESSLSKFFSSDVSNFLSDKSDQSLEKTNPVKSSQNITLMVQESIPIDSGIEKIFIPFKEDENGKNEETALSDCDFMSQGKLFSPDPERPIYDKTPINKDKLIRDKIVPNTSILNIINSIDKSAVIIQKDLYITDQIIQKIRKEEDKSKSDLNKSKLETDEKRPSSGKSHKLNQEKNIPPSNEPITNNEVTMKNNLHFSSSKLNNHIDGDKTKVKQHDLMHAEKPKQTVARIQDEANTQVKTIEFQDVTRHGINHRSEFSQCPTPIGYESLNLSEPKISNSKPLKEASTEDLQNKKTLPFVHSHLNQNSEIDLNGKEKKSSSQKMLKDDVNCYQIIENGDHMINYNRIEQAPKEKNNNDIQIEAHGCKITDETANLIEPMMVSSDFSSVVNQTKESFPNGNKKKNNIAQSYYISNKQKFGSSTTSSSNEPVDHIVKTTISSTKQNNFTSIEVSEVETVIDPRVPIPFSTETFFQIFGRDSSLHEHSSAIESTKYKLSLKNKFAEHISNLDINNLKQDDTGPARTPFSPDLKEPVKKSRHTKKVLSMQANTQSDAKNLSVRQEIKGRNTPNLNNITIGEKGKDTDGIVELIVRGDKKNRLSSETKSDVHNDQGKQKLAESNQNTRNKEIHKLKSDEEIKKSEINISDYYIDLFNFYKNEKVKKRPRANKGGIYEQNRLSKRDRKILAEIKKEIPKPKGNRKRFNKQPVRTTNSVRTTKRFIQPGKKQSEGVLNETRNKENIGSDFNSPLKIDKKNEPHGTHPLPRRKQIHQMAKEEQKVIDNTKNKMEKAINKKSSVQKSATPNLNQNLNRQVNEKHKSLQKETIKVNEHFTEQLTKKKEVKNINLTKIPTEHKDPEEKIVARGMVRSSGSSVENIDLKKTAPQTPAKQSNTLENNVENCNEDTISKKPKCHTFIATEAYINRPEQIKSIRDKTHTFPSFSELIEKNPPPPPPPPQKVTILEKYNKTATDKDAEAKEIFGKNLIKKSQEIIELKSGIDFRSKTPKIKNKKSKVQSLKRNKHKKEIKAIPLNDRVQPKEINKKTDDSSKPSTQKRYTIKNSKVNDIESTKSAGKVNIKKTQEESSAKNLAKKDQGKTIKNDSQNVVNKNTVKAASSNPLNDIPPAVGKKKSIKKHNQTYNTTSKSSVDIPSAKNSSRKRPSKKKNLKDSSSSKASAKMSSPKVILKAINKTERNATKNVEKSHNDKKVKIIRSQLRKKNSVAAAQEPVSVGLAATQKPVTVTQGPVTATQKPVTVTQGPASAAQKPVAVTQGPANATQKPVTVTQGPPTVTQGSATVTQGSVTVTQKPVTVTQRPTTVPKEPSNVIEKTATVTQKSSVQTNIANRKDFPMLIIDVDKMSKEINPDLDSNTCQKCNLPPEKVIDFPLHNTQKRLLFPRATQVLNIDPSRDSVLHKELYSFPSVTKILNSTIPENTREILRDWRRSMIDELGEEGFKIFYKGRMVNGSKFHSQLQSRLLASHPSLEELSDSSMKSIKNVLSRLTDISAISSHVIHRKLSYRGVIDCVAKHQNKPLLIEWKRLENPQVKVVDSSLDAASLQLSAYVGAINFDNAYKFQLSGGLIVVAYNDGSEAEVIEINKDQCTGHWKEWLKRLQQFQKSLQKRQK